MRRWRIRGRQRRSGPAIETPDTRCNLHEMSRAMLSLGLKGMAGARFDGAVTTGISRNRTTA
jgi:fumarylacetoacetate (FAA) hydrolase family protein